MSYFEGKSAAVTGAGSGIGRGLAIALNRAGCALELSDINEAALSETIALLERKNLSVEGRTVDVADRHAVFGWAEAVASRHDHLDILINNAGVALGGTAEENSIEDVEWLMGINFWGVIYGCKAFLPLLKQARGGHLVNISSVFGIIGVPTQTAYNAAKFAVRGYTEALRQEQDMAETGLHVCCVHPGGVTTNIARAARTNRSDAEHAEFAQKFEDMTGTTPASAADQILGAMQRRKPRLLIGRDAKVITLISRLFPTAYPRILAALGGKELKELVSGGGIV
ncbi:MAG: SDR family NAD(P)-dependent oxidoreductase [Halieaceae bacterium]|jgi:NADP-dependent 3-hydroxy acid dehydrogenase YdfG|nr:SDR family NAD(P)-dependent oxidoreductase [Halieaceae bacterium]